METKKVLLNGFTNYETFTFVLWLDNDKKMHDLVLEVLKTAYNKNLRRSNAIFEIQSFLETYLHENIHDNFSGFYRDLIVKSVNNINTFEVANHLFWNVLLRLTASCWYG